MAHLGQNTQDKIFQVKTECKIGKSEKDWPECEGKLWSNQWYSHHPKNEYETATAEDTSGAQRKEQPTEQGFGSVHQPR